MFKGSRLPSGKLATWQPGQFATALLRSWQFRLWYFFIEILAAWSGVARAILNNGIFPGGENDNFKKNGNRFARVIRELQKKNALKAVRKQLGKQYVYFEQLRFGNSFEENYKQHEDENSWDLTDINAEIDPGGCEKSYV
ncbi:hypothetical protein AVEN_106440-1 [Araneus ventricosus]|uniref:Uncharacterized protein n=1 Tax=Araneus ventricosus TaxID=182803 RepID=A0A4Y2AT76_ARAVE|nr:hypothetical protein AVEN_106440-1 [Araneus ventricosus]